MTPAGEPGGLSITILSPISFVVGLVAIGHLGLLLVLPANPPVAAILTVETVALAILVAGQVFAGTALRHLLVFCVLFAGVLALSITLVRVFDSVLLASVIFIAVVALFGYGIHRYELVALDIVEASDEQ